MTREEAEALAKSQPRYQVLVQVWKDIQRDGWKGIDILYNDGNRTGIGNPEAVAQVKALLIGLLSKQIEAARTEHEHAVR